MASSNRLAGIRSVRVPARWPRVCEESTNPPLFCAMRVTDANPLENSSFATWIDIDPSRMIFETSSGTSYSHTAACVADGGPHPA